MVERIGRKGVGTSVSTPDPSTRAGKGLGRRLLDAAVTAGFGIALVAFAAAVVLHLLGLQTLTVLTGSMRPGMPPGTVVVVKPIPAAQVRVGDVISFHPPSRPGVIVTHRVIAVQHQEVGPDLWTTKGDANPVADPWRVPAAGTVDREVFHVQGIGYLALALGSPWLKLLVISIPAVLLALALLVEVWQAA